jgi:hypothetical protein
MDKNEKLVNAVLERAQETDGIKKLACVEAFKLARDFQVGTIEIGRICNQQNIRICKCQLGLFP